MIFSKVIKPSELHLWFAWYPVSIVEGNRRYVVWLTHVWRILDREDQEGSYYSYRLQNWC